MTDTVRFDELTPLIIREWAGETIFKRGQDYHLRRRVRELATTAEGGLVAWVQGTTLYATAVSLFNGRLMSSCTCPYGLTCKHAVAVVLAYLDHDDQAALPIAGANDPRVVLLERLAAAVSWDEELLEAQPEDSPLRPFVTSLTQGDLVELVLELAWRFPDVRDALEVRRMLATDDAGQLEAEVLARIVAAGSVSPWRNRWDDEGNLPDYTPVRDGLQRLIDHGHADAVVRLGEVLLETGIRQVEQSHDGGETAVEVHSCLSLVFQALPDSSLAPHEQLRWAIEALLRDHYDLCSGAYDVFDRPYPPSAWSTVADGLLDELGRTPPEGEKSDFIAEYQRRHRVNLAIMALEGAGRDDEIIPLYEREAPRTNDYKQLVKRLLLAGRTDEAEEWALKGIAATQRRYPGIANELRDILRTLWAEQGDWGRVAALHAEEFFALPGLQTFRALEEAAEEAGCGPAIRARAMHYLVTGERPDTTGNLAAWPLPDMGLARLERRYSLQFPQRRVIIELALSEGRLAEALEWYDRQPEGCGSGINDDMLADAIAEAYPERAGEIWQALAEACIARTQVAAYEEAALYLRKIRRVCRQQGKEALWREYIAGLRATNRRKRRLIETLDTLVGEVD